MTYGRVVFALSAVLFGVIALLWHDAQTWQTLHAILALPFGGVLGDAIMAAQIAGGVLLFVPRASRPAAIVLQAVYAVGALTCLIVLVRVPATFDSFFEQLAMLCGALALTPRPLTMRLARIGLGIATISFTVTQAIYLKPTASLVPTWIPPNQMFWAVVTTVLFALAAVAMLIDVRARLAMRLMGLMTALFGLIVWVRILVAAPTAHTAWSEFTITMLITGASWVVADAMTPATTRGLRT